MSDAPQILPWPPADFWDRVAQCVAELIVARMDTASRIREYADWVAQGSSLINQYYRNAG